MTKKKDVMLSLSKHAGRPLRAPFDKLRIDTCRAFNKPIMRGEESIGESDASLRSA